MRIIKAAPKTRPLSEIQREQNAITRKMAKRGVPVVRVPRPKEKP